MSERQTYVGSWEYVSKNPLTTRDILLLLAVSLAFLFSLSFVLAPLLPNLILYDSTISILIIAFLLFIRRHNIKKIGWYDLALSGKDIQGKEVISIVKWVLHSEGYAAEGRDKMFQKCFYLEPLDFSVCVYSSKEVALISIGPQNELNRKAIKDIRDAIDEKLHERYKRQ